MKKTELKKIIREEIKGVMKSFKILKEADSEYQKFFRDTMKKFKIKSPSELSDKNKKKFFDYIDKNWDAGKNETDIDEALYLKEADSEYQKFFKATMDKFKIKSPAELSDANKKKFFNYIDKNWDAGKNETDIDETSSSAGAGAYSTAKAFVPKGKDYKKSPAAKAAGWNVVKRINESNTFSPMEKFFITVENIPENTLREELFEPLNQEYIDTPGVWSMEKNDYDDISDYLTSNMGRADFLELKRFYVKNKNDSDKFVKKYSKSKMFELTNRLKITLDKNGAILTKGKTVAYVVRDAIQHKQKNWIVKIYEGKSVKPFRAIRIGNRKEGIRMAKHILNTTNRIKKFNINEDIDFKSDDIELSPKQKIAHSIRGVREQLHIIEGLINKSIKLKEQNKLGSNDLYVRTRKALGKIGEQITRITNKLNRVK